MNYKYLFEIMLTHLDEGIFVVDKNANVTLYSEPASGIAGIDAKSAVGKNILEIFPDLTPETSTFYYVLRTKKPLIDHVQNYTNYLGKKVSTVTSTIPLFKNDELIGAMEVYRDLTYMKELSDKVYSLQRKLFKDIASQKTTKTNGAEYTFDDIIGVSSEIINLKTMAMKVAESPSPILIYGETGTGKELFVQSIHNASKQRSNKPFIAQNCAAIPKTLLEGILFGTTSGSFTGAKDKPGIFELANGGTLFLDEINSMDIDLQTKLLRVLQDGVIRRIGGTETVVVDVRVIAATNEPPLVSIEKKRLRKDLYYRLNVINLSIPPLRQRKDDIPVLVDYFINMYNKKLKRNVKGVSSDIMDMFLNYSWPGNVRELKYTIESIMNFIDDDVLYINELPSNLRGNFHSSFENNPIEDSGYEKVPELPPLKTALERYERELIQRAIEQSNGNYSKAARILSVPRQTLHNKIKKFNITWKVKIR